MRQKKKPSGIKIPILLVTLFCSCTTREDIARQKMVEGLDVAVKDQSKLAANITTRIQSMEEALAKLSGALEEREYKRKEDFTRKVESLEQKVLALEEANRQGLRRLDEHGEYLKRVIGTLKGMSVKKKARKKEPDPYVRAMANYRKKYYKSAKKQLLRLYEGGKVKGQRRIRVIHSLGMIAYANKNNKDALLYFSQLYTKYPKSAYNKSGLLRLAKTFRRMGKRAEAKSSLDELIRRYPKSAQAKEARKLLK